jgi:hypothetical protein
MALVKYGAGIIQASGSIAGTTFARNRFGNYMRARTKPVDPHSTRQAETRNIFAYLANYWSSTLTAAQRTAWATYAAAVSVNNRLGESVYLTGFNMFLRSNTVAMLIDRDIIADGPAELVLPSTDPTFEITADATTQKISIAFDDGADWLSDTEANMVIFMGEPQGATRNFFAGPFKYADALAQDATSPAEIDPPYTLVAGQKIWCYARILREDGRLSGKFRSNVIVASGA